MAGKLDRVATLLNEGRAKQAARACAKVLAQEPGNARAHFLAGGCALRLGEHETAVAHLERARELAGPAPEIANNLGSAYLLAGRLDEAETALRSALESRPDFAKAHVNLAGLLKIRNRLGEAETHLLKARRIAGNAPEIVSELAELLFVMRRWKDAAEAFRALVEFAPDDGGARSKLVSALAHAGDPAAALEVAREVRGEGAARADRLARCADALLGAGWDVEAYGLFREVLELDDGNPLARTKSGDLLSRMVPRWHFSMLQDASRNDSYDRVIRDIVQPDSVVLDIGSGSGLLAMMAARAGAAHVYSCEGVPVLAQKAREIVAANGLSERITILEKWSTDIKVGVDMPCRADVLISEILGHALIGEGCVASLEHALTELVSDDARITPRSGRLHVALLECAQIYERNHVREAAGFDVSLFNAFSLSGQSTSMTFARLPFEVLSAPFTPFEFDFTQPEFSEEAVTQTLQCTCDGTLHGVFAWFDLEIAEGFVIDSHPAREDNHWGYETCLLATPRAIRAGDRVTVEVRHDKTRVQLRIIE